MNIFKNKIKGDKKTIASNFVSLTVLQGANYLLPLLILPFLVRTLGSEKFGLVMFAQSLATLLKIVVDFGFTMSGTREISLARNDKKKLSEIFCAIILIKTGLIIVGFIILFFIVELFTRFTVDSEVYYLSFGIVIGQAIFPVWFFQGIEKMKFVTVVNIFAKVIFTVLIFLAIREESDYILVPIFNSLGFIIAGLLGLFISLKYIFIVVPRISLVKRLLKESSSLFFAKFASTLYTSSNVFILGLFTGNTIVGVYSSMEKLILAVKNIYTPLYQAMFPWLSNQTSEVKRSTIKKLFPFILSLGVIITASILIFGETMLTFIYDDELITSYVSVFKILSFISIFSGINMLYNNLYLPSIKKYKTRMLIFIIGGIFNLLLVFILIKQYGVYGMASAVTITEFLLLILGFYYFNKYSSQKRDII